MWLLQWLIDRADRVFDLVDTFFALIINAAVNAFKWAYDNAVHFFYEAVRIIEYWVGEVWGFAERLHVIALDHLNALSVEFYAWRDGVIQTVSDWFVTKIVEIKLWIEWAKTEAIELFTAAWGWLLGWLATHLATVIFIVWFVKDTILTVWNSIIDAITFIGDINTKLAIIAIRDNIASLLLIINNPVGFVFAVIVARFREWGDYLLGSALGTTDRPLPPPPIVYGRE